MAVITNQITVACTPEELFDYCVDIRNEVECLEFERRLGDVPARSDR